MLPAEAARVHANHRWIDVNEDAAAFALERTVNAALECTTHTASAARTASQMITWPWNQAGARCWAQHCCRPADTQAAWTSSSFARIPEGAMSTRTLVQRHRCLTTLMLDCWRYNKQAHWIEHAASHPVRFELDLAGRSGVALQKLFRVPAALARVTSWRRKHRGQM